MNRCLTQVDKFRTGAVDGGDVTGDDGLVPDEAAETKCSPPDDADAGRRRRYMPQKPLEPPHLWINRCVIYVISNLRRTADSGRRGGGPVRRAMPAAFEAGAKGGRTAQHVPPEIDTWSNATATMTGRVGPLLCPA